MNKIGLSFLVIIFFIFTNCTNQTNIVIETKFDDSLEQAVISYGDSLAFEELIIKGFKGKVYMMPYSKIMVDKYHYSKFGLQVFYAFYKSQNLRDSHSPCKCLDSLSEKDKKEALCYLLIGAQSIDATSLYELSCYLREGMYFKKDTVLAKSMLKIWRKKIDARLKENE
jgi:hypothetical protein